MKKLYETVLALTLVLTYLRATVRAIEAPEPSNPSNCSCNGINEPKEDMQVYRYPPITSEQLKAFYKENPYKFNGFPKDKNLY